MAFVNGLLMMLLLVTAIFLIVLVLIQRGKGGGLAGAFGGMGGQSAFGTKAGDLFTKITIGVASFWIILCSVHRVGARPRRRQGPLGEMGTGGEAKPRGIGSRRARQAAGCKQGGSPRRAREDAGQGELVVSGQWSVAGVKRRRCRELVETDCTHLQLT